MEPKDKTLAELLGDMKHYCIVVKDIEEAVTHFSKMGYKFGAIQLRARSSLKDRVLLRGQPISYSLKAAVATNTKPAVELTEVVEGEPTQKEFLDSKGHSVHHVCYGTPDIEVAIAKFKELGIDVIQRPMEYHNGIKWAMMDTVDMCGMYIEVVEQRNL